MNDAQLKEKKKPGVFLKIFGRLILIFFLGSLYQVLYYKFLPPLYTPTMIFNWFEALTNPKVGGSFQYDWESIDNISPYMPLAVIASEDQKFLNHIGFDVESIKKAWRKNKKGKRIRGGSTISQQVAKNLFLWQGRNFIRKGLEAYYTILIELLWSKQRIAEVYINVAQMGPQVYGAEAASLKFFKKSASKLSRRDAALLAAVLPNPKKYSVKNPSSYIIRRQGWISRQMGYIGGLKYIEQL